MTRNQAVITALIGAAYLFASTLFDGYTQTLLSFVAGLHIAAAFTIKE